MWTAEGVVLGNSFWTDHACDLISHTFKSRQWADRLVSIVHNAKAYDLHFIIEKSGADEIFARAPRHKQAEIHVPDGGECHEARQPQLPGHATRKPAKDI
jgi:hypothetical protein